MAGLRIDHDTCTLAGECVYNHPELFGWDGQDRPVVLRPDVAGDDLRGAAQAVAGCPSGAISLDDHG